MINSDAYFKRYGGLALQPGQALSGVAPQNLGMNIAGGIGSGASAGGTIGSMFMPGLGTAIGTGVGALIGAVGAGISGAKEREAEEERQRREQEMFDKNFALNRAQTQRSQNLQGADLLMAMRNNAMNNFGRQRFGKSFLRAAGGM